MTKEKLVEIIYRAFPYSEQITDLDFEEKAICYTWRGKRFRTEANGQFSTMTVDDGVLIGDDIALLARTLLQRTSVMMENG